MKKTKFSLVEKKLFRTILSFTLIQILIILIFVNALNSSYPININDTKQIDITVDDLYINRVFKSNYLIVVSELTKYEFTPRSTFKEYSVSKLHKTIFLGDSLSLIYYESNHFIWGTRNIVIDARTQTETYRSYEEYIKGKEGSSVAIIIIFSLIEIAFLGIILVDVWLNKNIIKGINKKIKKLIKK